MPNSNELSVISNIEELRVACNLTRPQLSKIIGVPVRTIENWEYGITKIKPYIENMVIAKMKEYAKQDCGWLKFDKEIPHGSTLPLKGNRAYPHSVIIYGNLYDVSSIVDIYIFEITLPNGDVEYVYPSDTHIYNLDVFQENGNLKIYECTTFIESANFDASLLDFTGANGKILHYVEVNDKNPNKLKELNKNCIMESVCKTAFLKKLRSSSPDKTILS